MKIVPINCLLLASLYVLPSVSAVRGRSLVRGVTARSNHRMLDDSKDSKDSKSKEGDDEFDSDDAESKEERRENPIAPKKRDCKMRQGSNEVSFECKAKSDDANAKVKDEIDYSVRTSGRGLQVEIKYEQEIEIAGEDGSSSDGEDDRGSSSDRDDERGSSAERDEDRRPSADRQEDTEEQPEGEDSVIVIENDGDERQPGDRDDEEADDEDESEERRDGERSLQAEQETETQFEVIYDSIIEYTKGEGSSGEAYDWENDVVLQTISLDSWDVFSEVVVDNSTSTFSVTSPDGKITFTFTINQAATGEQVTANKMKIDFELRDFPWTSDDSFVALLSTVETEREVDVQFKRGMESEAERMAAQDVFISFENSANSTSFIPFGEYTWAETAEASSSGGNPTTSITTNATTEDEPMIESQTNATDAPMVQTRSVETITVVATSPVVERAARRTQEGKQVQSIAYSFVGGNAAHRASMIYWDPSAGVDYQSSARPLSLALAGAGIVLSFFALF